MNHRHLIVLGTAAALTLGFAAPALADVTTATVTVTGGVLEVNSPDAAGSLGSQANTVNGVVISGSMGQVVVSDARGAAAGSAWVASAISTAFTPPSGPAIPASAVAYTTGTISKIGTATYAPNDPTNLTGVAPVVTASGITGSNSATWSPMIHVTLPGNMAAATYTATITHSVV